jgi:hypothetical protein
MAHDGATDRDALALAAGELARLALEQRLDAQDLAGLAHALEDSPSCSRALQAETPCCRTRSCADRARSSGTPWRCSGSIGGRSFTTASPMRISPEVISSRPGHHAQGRGLAAARRADQHQEFLVADLEVDVLHGVEAVVVLLVQRRMGNVGHLTFHRAGQAGDVVLDEERVDERRAPDPSSAPAISWPQKKMSPRISSEPRPTGTVFWSAEAMNTSA